eukprot:8164-Heterococcus_DN1.PRE.12
MLAAFFSAAGGVNRAINTNYRGVGEDSLVAVRQAVIKRVDEVAVTIENAAINMYVQQFMATNFTASTTGLQESLDIIRNVMELEYLAIVSPSKHIMFSCNTPEISSANGALYNPANILNYAENRTVSTVAVLSYDELMKERPPLYRGRESRLDEAAAGRSPFETKDHSLIAYVATPARVVVDLKLPKGVPPNAYIIAGTILSSNYFHYLMFTVKLMSVVS